MVLIDKYTIEKIKREGKVLNAFIREGETREVTQARNLMKAWTNICNCGLGIIPSLYTSDLVCTNQTIENACVKTLEMIKGLSVPNVRSIIKNIMKQTTINIPKLKVDLTTIKDTIHGMVDAILINVEEPTNYHVTLDNGTLKLLGVNGIKYCSHTYQLSKKVRCPYTLRVHGTTLIYDKSIPIESDCEYDLKQARKDRKEIIIRPIIRNKWLSKRFDSQYALSHAEYEALDPVLKSQYAYHQCNTNQFVVDYLFYQLIANDHDKLLNPNDLRGFRMFMQNINRTRL